MWRIGQLARMAGVSDRTLRHYDRIGLLRPAAVDADGGTATVLEIPVRPTGPGPGR
ncbi:MerR family DNA-binding transcriptional regulator [Actinosynnema sp. NPDC050801]|uniref:MerR family DNA-binding transcriptional regulator n=1 Tax=unclassified Actinosynnema TaxID=2637065 RepID=UPI0034088414